MFENLPDFQIDAMLKVTEKQIKED